MVELEVWRYRGTTIATLGHFMLRGESTWEQLCFALEDRSRPLGVKVRGTTRIPAGRYAIELRTEGGMHARYQVGQGAGHRGMLWLRDVPGFKWVYIHIGNDDDDTEGCILVGEDRNEAACTIGRSRAAYSRIYPRIAAAIEAEGAWITLRDLDQLALGVPPSG